ncbi:hypothetical protein ACM66B_000116 [Microbotryomycetes sp. NB124-2]
MSSSEAVDDSQPAKAVQPTSIETSLDVDASSGTIIIHETPEASRTIDLTQISTEPTPETKNDNSDKATGGDSSYEVIHGADTESPQTNDERTSPLPDSPTRLKLQLEQAPTSSNVSSKGKRASSSRSRLRSKSPVSAADASKDIPSQSNTFTRMDKTYSAAVLDPKATSFDPLPSVDIDDKYVKMSVLDILKHGKDETGELKKEARQALAKMGLKGIPAMHGPLSLPYARCPSGIDAFVFSIDKDEDPYTFSMSDERNEGPRGNHRAKVPLPGNARYANASGARGHRNVSAPAAINHAPPPMVPQLIPVVPVHIVQPHVAAVATTPALKPQPASISLLQPPEAQAPASSRRRRSSRNRSRGKKEKEKDEKDAIDEMIEEAETKHSSIPTNLLSSPPLDFAMSPALAAPPLPSFGATFETWPYGHQDMLVGANSFLSRSQSGPLPVPAAFYPLPPHSLLQSTMPSAPSENAAYLGPSATMFPQHYPQFYPAAQETASALQNLQHSLASSQVSGLSDMYTTSWQDPLTYQHLYHPSFASNASQQQSSQSKGHSRGPSLRANDASVPADGRTIERRRSAAPIVPVIGSSRLAQGSPNLVPHVRRSSISSAPFTQTFALGVNPQSSLILPPTPTTPSLSVTPATENTPLIQSHVYSAAGSTRARSPFQGSTLVDKNTLTPDFAIKLSDPPAVRGRHSHTPPVSSVSGHSMALYETAPKVTERRSSSSSRSRERVHQDQQSLSVASSMMREPAGGQPSRARRGWRGRRRGSSGNRSKKGSDA